MIVAGLLALLVSQTADAGPLRRNASSGEPRFPRVRRVVQLIVVPYPYTNPNVPSNGSFRPGLDGGTSVASIALTILAFAGSDVFTPLSWGLPPALRTARVVLFGSPAVGPPRDTLIWIGSPFALWAAHKIRERRGIDPTGGQVLIGFRRER
jgi:hypothetical protein